MPNGTDKYSDTWLGRDVPEEIARPLKIKRLMERVEKIPGGCWNWLLSVSTHGYGRMWVCGVHHQSHRFAYELLIGPDAGACSEAVRHGETGLLAKSGDAESFGDRICEILSKPAVAAEMGRAAREYVMHRYSIERAVDGMLECYARAVRIRGTLERRKLRYR